MIFFNLEKEIHNKQKDRRAYTTQPEREENPISQILKRNET